MKFLWLLTSLLIISTITVATQYNAIKNWITLTYSEKAIEKQEMVCENFTINSTSQKLLDYEILSFSPNITIINKFGDNISFVFGIRGYNVEFENDFIKEYKKKPFAIYYGMWGCNPIGGGSMYCDAPTLYFSPKVNISSYYFEKTNVPRGEEVVFPFQIEIMDDRPSEVRKNWRFSIYIPYSIFTTNEETHIRKSCEGMITLTFEGSPMEFYLDDFIGGTSPLKSPWEDYVYGGFPNSVETILPPSIEISNITFSRETNEIKITFSTHAMMGICSKSGVIPADKPYCFSASLILEKEHLILRDKPFGAIKKEFSEDFLTPFVVKSDGNEYTLTIPQQFPIGAWYEELWFRGKLRYENTYYNEVYEEPYVLFLGIGRLWYFR